MAMIDKNTGKITISSLNCQGLGNSAKRRDIFHYIRQKHYSIYCLQDTHFDNKMETYIQSEWGYKCFFSSFSSNARGVAVLFNNNFEFKINKIEKDDNGNMLVISFTSMDKNFVLVNIYGPNKDDPLFYENLTGTIKEYKNNNIIVVGDFNIALDQDIDCCNYKQVNNPKARKAVEEMMLDLGLADIWRENNPDCKRYTWRRPNPLKQSRLDYFLLSDLLIWYFEDADILPGYRSDHSMVTLTLQLKHSNKPNTFWKFNASLLRDKEYVDEINSEILMTLNEYLDDSNTTDKYKTIEDILKSKVKLKVTDKVFLDFVLMKIRSKTISYATMRKRNIKQKEQDLEKDIYKIERKEHKTEEDINILQEKNEELITLREKIMSGVLLRSKTRWISEGEKATKYFFSLEKRNYISKHISKLVNKKGETLDTYEEIRKEIRNFYEELYKCKDLDDCSIEDLVHTIPKLSGEEAMTLEGEITQEEASWALKNMKNEKSPGTDGFGAEFFKCFWRQLGGFVVRALNESFRDGELSVTQREGIITCIPKQDKPKHLIKNWRPISLLNVIYKIGSACIANRIKKILPTLINEDQTGFVPNRYMGYNIRMIYDIINYLDSNNLPGILINLDFEKAFDSLDWKFMYKVLKAFGFGRDICRWISTFYNNIKSTVIVNGQTTGWFPIERGCRQGDPLSPYIFVLCVEIFAIMIREDEDIKGIQMKDTEQKIAQFADDTQLMNEGDKESFEKSISLLEKFSKTSGLFLNNDKTQVIWLGSKKFCKTKYMEHLNMVWNPPTFKILGIWFTQSLKDMEDKNYNEKMREIRALFKIWMKRFITPLGRVAVLKSLILSKLTHLWIFLPNPPDKFTKDLQLMCFQFVWRGKQDRISRRTVIREEKRGGLNVPNLQAFMAALKLTWINRLKTTTHKWKYAAFLNCPQAEDIDNFSPNYLCLNTKNPFWKHVFLSYKSFFYKVRPVDVGDILAEPVLHNDNIKVGNKPITFKSWRDKNINKISDLYKQNGDILSYNEFQAIYNINIDFLTYAGCIMSIKDYIIGSGFHVQNNISATVNIGLKIIYSVPKGSQLYYKLLNDDYWQPKCCSTWIDKLGRDVSWDVCFKKMHKIKDIKLKWLQIRIIHRIIPTNVVLKEMGVKECHDCSFCESEKDSIVHLFWRCPWINNFWNKLENLVRDKCENAKYVRLTENIVLFGSDKDFVSDVTFDLIILLAKQYIFQCKVAQSKPLLSVFQKQLKCRYEIDKYIAQINFEQNKFLLNWCQYEPLLYCQINAI